MSSKKKETTSEPAFDLEQQFILRLPPVSILQNLDNWNDRYEQSIDLYTTWQPQTDRAPPSFGGLTPIRWLNALM